MSDNSHNSSHEPQSENHVDDLLDAVCDKDTFLNFVSALAHDFQDGFSDYGANGWAQGTVDSFLEAIVACADGKRDRYPEEASWKTFAQMLYGGKFYE